jgi:hypothetical protein
VTGKGQNLGFELGHGSLPFGKLAQMA